MAYLEGTSPVQLDPTEYIVRLICKEKRDILVINDNRTLSTTRALAALRGSFAGVYCCSEFEEPIDAELIKRNLQANADAALARHHPFSSSMITLRKYGLLKTASNPDEWKAALEAELPGLASKEFDQLDFWLSADNIGNLSAEDVPKGLIWMNFPWRTYAHSIASYIREFLQGCSSLQSPGDVVLLTVTRNERWREFYDIDGILALAQSLGYHYVVDRYFVSRIFDYFGYRHVTWNRENDIHYYVVPCSETYIFTKADEPQFTKKEED